MRRSFALLATLATLSLAVPAAAQGYVNDRPDALASQWVATGATYWTAQGYALCPTITVFRSDNLRDVDGDYSPYGRAFECAAGATTIWIADVILDPAMPDWERCYVAVHEVGHTLGFDHDDPRLSGESAAFMSSQYPADVSVIEWCRDRTVRNTRVEVRTFSYTTRPARCGMPRYNRLHKRTCRLGIKRVSRIRVEVPA